ncbi:MAG: radical SAM protein [Planctomycetaceae bacterium]
MQRFTSAFIREQRGEKNEVDPYHPYAFLVEPECGPNGQVQDVATLFLTNRECPFTCLMCDLWKNTLNSRIPVGTIPQQIDYALERMPTAQSIKLYNSGNFFDPQAIPPEDYPAIAQRMTGFRTVIVENHPRLIGPRCLEFQQLLPAGIELEVAMGLETVHQEALAALNKEMTTDDFARAASFFVENNIAMRAFVLLKPPFLSEAEGLEWALKSTEFAFDQGVRTVAIIPTRGGNGVMEQLADSRDFSPPSLRSLEAVLDAGLAMKRGRVFVDLWDAEKLIECPVCGPKRIERLQNMNLTQCESPRVTCSNCAG